MSTLRPDGVIALDDLARAKRRGEGLRRKPGEAAETHTVWDTSINDVTAGRLHGSFDLSIRAVRASDAIGLARVSSLTRLNQPEQILSGYSARRSAFAASARWKRNRPRMFVACVDEKIVGFVHFQPVYQDQRWHAVAVGTATGVYDASPVEDELLRHAVTAAGLHGVKRLYARIQSGTDLVNSFERVGFTPFATETIFVAETYISGARLAPIRAQDTTDTWAIHQLYNATAPRQVQYAEALTSHRWDLTGISDLTGTCKRFGWLVDDSQGLASYARVSCRDGVHLLELLYSPERTESLGVLLDSVVPRLRSSGNVKRLCVALRGYQVEAAKVLESRGFDPVMEQDLLVKYTTATARAPHFELLPLSSDVIERLPKRVPSFLQQAAADESAS